MKYFDSESYNGLEFSTHNMLELEDMESDSKEISLPSLKAARSKMFDPDGINSDYLQKKSIAALYKDTWRKKLVYQSQSRAKNLLSKRDSQISHSYDKRKRGNGKGAVSSSEKIKKKKTEDEKIKGNFGYKPPLYGNNKGFAAQMMRNKRKYFTKKAISNIKSTSKKKEIDQGNNYGTVSTAEARRTQSYSKNALSYSEQDSATIHESDLESDQRVVPRVSHHARIKDKLKLLKNNLRNQH